MRTFKIFFLIFFFLNFKSAFANENISYLNMEYVIKNSNIGKSTLEKISKLNDQNIEKLKLKDEEIKKMEESINQKKNILSKDELNKEITQLKLNINKFMKEKDMMVKNINELKKKELNNLYKKINPIIQSYMDENNIKILLDIKNIIIGKSDLNITEDIIKEINKKLN